MKKRLAMYLALTLVASMLAGCGSGNSSTQTEAEQTTTAEATAAQTTEAEGTTAETTAEGTAAETTGEETTTSAKVRVGALKGPTSMGLVGMMDDEETYSFTMQSTADALVADVAAGRVDIALVPANVASVLYNKTGAGVSVIDINTLSVLSILESGDEIQSIADLKGKTVYLTGKGATPDYALQYLMKENGLEDGDVTLEYKSEATEVASVLAEDDTAIGLLPQPFVTSAMSQNENLRIAVDLGEAWDEAEEAAGGTSRLVTGVTIVRNEFLSENEDLVTAFLAAHEESAAWVNANPADASVKIADLGIVAKAALAEKAIPNCSITYIDGEEMKESLFGYLSTLYELDATCVGGELPGEDFYYIP